MRCLGLEALYSRGYREGFPETMVPADKEVAKKMV